MAGCWTVSLEMGVSRSHHISHIQIALRTQEAMVDVHLDPILYQSCGIDIQRVCSGVQPGHSRGTVAEIERSSADFINTVVNR